MVQRCNIGAEAEEIQIELNELRVFRASVARHHIPTKDKTSGE